MGARPRFVRRVIIMTVLLYARILVDESAGVADLRSSVSSKSRDAHPKDNKRQRPYALPLAAMASGLRRYRGPHAGDQLHLPPGAAGLIQSLAHRHSYAHGTGRSALTYGVDQARLFPSPGSH